MGLVAGAALITLALQAIPQRREIAEGTPVIDAILNDPDSPSAGPATADITVVEFSDYLCAPCKSGEAAFERAIARDGRVRVLYKDWPILGPASRSAARFALAAARQGKYLSVHNALLRARARLDAQALGDIARATGVDERRLQADLTSDGGKINHILQKNAHQAWTLGLQGDPGYLVGPYVVRGPLSLGELGRLIEAARHRRR